MQSISIFSAVIFFIAIGAVTNIIAQGRFTINTSLAAIGGNLSDSSLDMAYYLYGGLRYQTQDYYLSLNLPLVFNSSGSFTQLGGMYIPNGNDTGGGMHGSGSQGSMMNESEGMSSLNAGIGDMYLYGSYTLIKETNTLPAFSTDGFVKFPTATPSLRIGTGNFDFNIAMSVRKYLGTFLFLVQGGYLFLGNSDEPDIENPITLSAGIGKYFGSGNHLFLLEYDSYSTIVMGFASPKQLSFGYTYFINPGLSWTTIGSAGLNSSTSDYIISVGLNFNL